MQHRRHRSNVSLHTDSLLLKWFCVRTQVKREHLAAEHLRRLRGIEVFLPRIRFRRNTRRGTVWFTEALFPNYLFARFDWKASLAKVHHAPNIRGVIHFGDKWPTIPDDVIDQLRQIIGERQLCVVDPAVAPGDQVQIADGVFHGLKAVVTQVMPARQRVTVLLNFLGRQTSVELPAAAVLKETNHRRGFFEHQPN